MKTLLHRALGLSLAAGFAGLVFLDPLPACAPIPPKGAYVFTASETALIVWDAEKKTEHFIRRASFTTEVKDFGFLVPTPSQPKLAEAGDEAFSRMDDWTKPEVVEQIKYRERDWKGRDLAVGSSAPKPGGVAVLDRQRVGGFDAVVLKASDPKELEKWLGDHGYHAGPAVQEWLKSYVEQEWFLTAFKIAKGDGPARDIGTSAVVMSFTTDKPFFPYSEPSSQRSAEHAHQRRTLRVYVVGEARMKGSLPAGEPTWPGKAVWANKLDAGQAKELNAVVGKAGVTVEEGRWLTVFEDHAAPRPGTADLFFSKDPNQSTLKRPPIIRTVYRDAPRDVGWLWGWALVGGVGVAGILALAFMGWWFSMRRAG